MSRKNPHRAGEDRVAGRFTADLQHLRKRNTGPDALTSLTQPDR
jgi:hypothetical protein